MIRHPLWPQAAAIMLVAATYTYFLLFAQFGFLQGIRATKLGPGAIQTVLIAMAIAGAAASLSAPRVIAAFGRGGSMSLGFLICAGAAASAGFAFRAGETSIGHFLIAALGIGAGLGLATVGLAADLRRLTRARHLGLCVGAGTGLAYGGCSLPGIYDASPIMQAWGVGLLAALVVVVVGCSRGFVGPPDPRAIAPSLSRGWTGPQSLVWVIAAFFVLVWFDSAAFAALQLTSGFEVHWWNTTSGRAVCGVVHLVTAIGAGLMLDRGRLPAVLAAALIALLIGAAGFLAPAPKGIVAALLYVGGVSSYSTALVAFAPLASADQERDRAAWRAAWLYAWAGWVASTLGVGLAEHTGRLPTWTGPVAAGCLLLSLWRLGARRAPSPS